MEFLSDESEFSRKSRADDNPNSAKGNMILWASAIMILLGLNGMSWVFCLWVFWHPEEHFCYKLLQKVDKMPPLKNFTPTQAPRGAGFKSVKDLHSLVFYFNEQKLKNFNAERKRFFIQNYYGVKEKEILFLSGNFTVQNVRQLDEDDIFPSGYAVRGRATDFPDAFIDLVIPTTKILPSFLKAGEALTIERSNVCAVLLHAERLPEDQMVFTVIPLVSSEFVAANGESVVSKTPGEINLKTPRWPLSDNGLVSNPIAPIEAEAGDTSEDVAVADGKGE